MPNAKSSSLPRILIAAGGIYTAQSLIGGLTFMGIPAVLRANNVALDKIGLISLVMLVWAVKFLWAPPLERLRIRPNGNRRSRKIILIGEVITASLLVALGLTGAASFTIIIALLLLMAIASATIDIACDAFIIEQLTQNKRGAGNVAQVGGGYLGLIFGSGLFVTTLAVYGWLAACILLACLVLLMSLPMALAREANVPPVEATKSPSLRDAFQRFDIRTGLIMAVVFEMGGRLTQSLTGPFLVDAGVPLSLLGILNGMGGVIAGIFGAAVGGLLVQRSGSIKAVLYIATVHVIALCGVALIVVLGVRDIPVLVTIFILESAVMAAGFVAIYSRLMGLVSPSQPGVDFTLFQSASAVAAALFGTAGGILAHQAGYATSFVMSAGLAIVTPPLLMLLERRLTKGTSS
ncbi:MFS transporter [Brucella pseudogrignonensis]|uniref:MFS transporter (Putative signal transducer) n=1 Tax=Brucella pseudogrignonensis TaxID=419475 RepID=A0ABU1MCJ9_9HYPH|nr:MFS transporter [Brucella pseudogrignonensis]MDR6433486.1 MFS transporter (putative signal transducer) [Brucella pseudogrignonensis]